MKKKLAFAVILLGIAGLSLPAYNLLVPYTSNALQQYKSDDPLSVRAAAILSEKCAGCHSQGSGLPVYGSLPVAKQLLALDISMGTKNVDYVKELMPEKPQPISAAALAKTESVVEKGSMPPGHYLAMHWNHALNADDKKTLTEWARETRAKQAPVGIPAELAKEVLQPLPDTVNVDPAKVALGDKLFHDVRLSKDNTVACATCHDLKKGGTDQLPFSKGVGGAVGGINAPTVFNSAFQFIQFWDGRAADLAAQADGPVNNPAEMASNWDEATAKLSQDAEFTAAFNAVYPDGYKKDNFVNAIAEFEKTLVTPGPFDKYLKGDENALTADQKAGLKIFKDTGCANCHCGPILGGQSFELMGLHKDYFADRGNVKDADLGRFSVTKVESDKHRLKVPTLRNIKLTAPYFHDSTTSDLAKAVETMAKYQSGTTLSTEQVAQVVQFLEALTGEFRGQKL
jgi:cytochrome c peroxidase